jgi:hypothetical protein
MLLLADNSCESLLLCIWLQSIRIDDDVDHDAAAAAAAADDDDDDDDDSVEDQAPRPACSAFIESTAHLLLESGVCDSNKNSYV